MKNIENFVSFPHDFLLSWYFIYYLGASVAETYRFSFFVSLLFLFDIQLVSAAMLAARSFYKLNANYLGFFFSRTFHVVTFSIFFFFNTHRRLSRRSIKIFSFRILRTYVYTYATKERKKERKTKRKRITKKLERLIISQYRTQSLYEIADRTV